MNKLTKGHLYIKDFINGSKDIFLIKDYYAPLLAAKHIEDIEKCSKKAEIVYGIYDESELNLRKPTKKELKKIYKKIPKFFDVKADDCVETMLYHVEIRDYGFKFLHIGNPTEVSYALDLDGMQIMNPNPTCSLRDIGKLRIASQKECKIFNKHMNKYLGQNDFDIRNMLTEEQIIQNELEELQASIDWNEIQFVQSHTDKDRVLLTNGNHEGDYFSATPMPNSLEQFTQVWLKEYFIPISISSAKNTIKEDIIEDGKIWLASTQEENIQEVKRRKVYRHSIQ